MSTASSANPITPSRERSADRAPPLKAKGTGSAAPDLLDRVVRADSLVVLGVLGVGFLALFHNWLINQHAHSWGNGDWSHAYLVPLISVYLIWQKRREIAGLPARTYWPGLAPVLMGVWAYVYFIAGVPNHLGQGLAMILTLFGLVLLLLGPALTGWLFLPMAYLVFAVTLPELVMTKLTFKLQQIAASGSWVVLNAIGVHTDLTGNVLHVIMPDMSSRPLNVAEQCSGMRMVIAFMALGVAVALVGVKSWWKRVVLVALGVPVALVLNVARVVVLGVLSRWDENLTTGEAHTFIGTVLLVPGFLLYMLVLAALNKAVPERKPGEDELDRLEPMPPALSGVSA